MKIAKVLISGVVFAALAASSDQSAEERYRMKYGRYTPAEEARRQRVEAERKDVVEYVGETCCRHMPQDTALAMKPSANEAWFRAKFGRNTPAYEAGRKAADVQVAAYLARCAELGRCPLFRVSKTDENSTTVATNLTDTEARFRMKYGRGLPMEERRKTTPIGPEERLALAAAEGSPCTETCCKQGE
jgi:hypothetical protein